MARIGIVFGLVLFGLSIVALSMTAQKSYTQFIPMMFGIPLLFCGVVALNPHRKGGAVFAALILASVGAVIGTVRAMALTLSWWTGGHINLLSLELVVSMSIVCCVFVVIAERWRRRRKAERNRIEQARQRSASLANSLPPATETIPPCPGGSENPYQTPAILTEPPPTSPTDDPAK